MFIINEKRLTKASLCQQLGVTGGAANQYIGQQSLHAAILWKLGQIIGFDFFDWLSKESPLQIKSEKELNLNQQIADLTKENEIYKNLLSGRFGK